KNVTILESTPTSFQPVFCEDNQWQNFFGQEYDMITLLFSPKSKVLGKHNKFLYFSHRAICDY
ncbi:MAG: hypothetical protein KDD63_09610, partial [Bacteroidetes bacterium]|nr:hypothetical protein [Bacteroidota bacterium]